MTIGTPISTTMTQVSVGSLQNIWGVDAATKVYRYTGSGSNWTQTAGYLTNVTATADGAVLGVNAVGDIFRYRGSQANSWEQISGKLAQISAGSANSNVWGVNSAGNIYSYNGNNTWTQIAGNFKQVAVGADGTVRAVDPAGNIQSYNGNNTWTQMPGNTGCGQLNTPTGLFTQVTVGLPTFIRALDPAGHVYTYYGSDPWSCEGIIDLGVKCIALASDQTFVFIDSTGTTRLVPYVPQQAYG